MSYLNTPAAGQARLSVNSLRKSEGDAYTAALLVNGRDEGGIAKHTSSNRLPVATVRQYNLHRSRGFDSHQAHPQPTSTH